MTKQILVTSRDARASDTVYYDQVIVWRAKKNQAYSVVNVSLIKSKIENYDKNQEYSVVLDNVLLSNTESISGKNKFNFAKVMSTRTYPCANRETVNGEIIYVSQVMDIFDMIKTIRDAERANMWLGMNIGGKFYELMDKIDNVLRSGVDIIEENFHNKKTIGTVLAYIRRRLKELMPYTLSENAYKGNNKVTKLYTGTPVTVRLNSLVASELKDYYLKDSIQILNDEGDIDFKNGSVVYNNTIMHVVERTKKTFRA